MVLLPKLCIILIGEVSKQAEDRDFELIELSDYLDTVLFWSGLDKLCDIEDMEDCLTGDSGPSFRILVRLLKLFFFAYGALRAFFRESIVSYSFLR